MGDRYIPVNLDRGARFCFMGETGTGKTELALALTLHPAVYKDKPGAVLYGAADEGSELLEGIPVEMVQDGRLVVERPGWDDDGRLKGEEYGDSWLQFAETPHPNANAIIVDCINTMGENRVNDEPTSSHGREYVAGQRLCVEVYRKLWEQNPQAHIVLLHHLDIQYKTVLNDKGKEVQVFDTYTPATVGRQLQKSWPGRFTGVFMTYVDSKSVINMATEDTEEVDAYMVRLRKSQDNRHLKMKGGPGSIVPATIDVTVTEAGNFEPLLQFWDKVLELTDSAGAARAAMRGGK